MMTVVDACRLRLRHIPSIIRAQSRPHAARPTRDRDLDRQCVWNGTTSRSTAISRVYISKAVFPNSDPTISLLLTLGTFALSFVTRPLGGVLLGIYADRYGRKASLMVSILMMTLGHSRDQFHADIRDHRPAGADRGSDRAAAPGVFGAAANSAARLRFWSEHMPERRGFIASWQFASQGLANLFASAFGVGLTLWMAPADLQSWGWRIPFLFGALVGPGGLYIRNHLEDATAPPAVIYQFADPAGAAAPEASRAARYRRARGLDRDQLSNSLHADPMR